MKKLLLVGFVLCTLTAFSQNKVLPKNIQIKTAVQAAPEMYREGAKVLGYDQNGKLVILREGTNDMICLADDPDKKGISVACYSDKLEPFMKRGRELIAEGKTETEKRQIRKEEIEEGKLKMPSVVAMLYVLSADDTDYNPQTGEFKKSYLRYVLYKPYMTAAETGLPTKPQGPGMPWLMDANSQRSHIMISPKRE